MRNKIFDFLFSRYSVTYIVFVFGLIIFHKPVEDLLSNTIVDYILSFGKTSELNDFLFTITSALILIFFFTKIGKYHVSTKGTIAIFTLSLFYLCYRFNDGEPWVFYHFSFNDKLKYSDILLLSGVCNILFFLSGLIKEKQPERQQNSFFDDEPVSEINDDDLGYKSYAKELAGKINKSYLKKAFAIGINGKWGLGKTSFINLIRKNLNEEIIMVEFNAWNSHSPQAIVQDFFETIQEKIRPYHSSLARLMVSYSNKLVELHSNSFTKTIQTSISAYTGFESATSMNKTIDESLRKINKKIVVVIDDLDRLDKDEIVEVLRLIRNTANFNNTFFIVAYDRNYIINALEKHNPYSNELYLEKIFQIEITLPYFKKLIYQKKLAEKLKQAFDKKYHELIEDTVIGKPFSLPAYLNEWLENMRDVSRLANSLSLNLKTLIDEVVFADFIRLELLRLKYPSVYLLLFEKKNDFLGFQKNVRPAETYILKPVEEQNNQGNGKRKTKFEIYITENIDTLSIPKNEIEKIVDFVDGIFGGGFGFRERNKLSVVYPSKFYRYFAYNLMDDNLSEVEFSNARSGEIGKFKDKITEWIEKGLETEVIEKFKQINDYDNKEDFKNVITGIFHLAHQERKNKEGYDISIGTRIIYDKTITEKLYDWNNSITEKYFEGKAEELIQFIRTFFEQAKAPFIFESSLIHHINKEYGVTFPIDRSELLNFAIKYFEEYSTKTAELDSTFFHLFYQCEYTDWEETGNSTIQGKRVIPDEAKEIFKKYLVERGLDEYLLIRIAPERFDKKIFAIPHFDLPNVFDNIDSFGKFLEEQSEVNWKYLKEYKEFYNKCKEEGFKKYVDFHFKVIPIEEKIKKMNN